MVHVGLLCSKSGALHIACSVFPNCTAKPKGEKAMYVGDMLLDPKSEISQLTLRRPFDRVSNRHAVLPAAVLLIGGSSQHGFPGQAALMASAASKFHASNRAWDCVTMLARRGTW
jgi:hypothetical protein